MLPNRLFYLFIVVFFIVPACTPASTQASVPTVISSPTVTAPSTQLPTFAPTPTAVLAVMSTLDGLTTLPYRISWVAQPTVPEDKISEVDFLIDGQLTFIEEHAPYTFGRDGGDLVTSFLTPGEHSFTVHVVAVDGRNAESTVKAMVAAPLNPPDELADTSWTREMTESDRQKATSSEPPPSGEWGLTMNSVGWMVHDPDRGGLLFDVEYQSEGKIELRAAIEKPPYPNPQGGAFCEEPDPAIAWTYTISDGGKTLTLHPVSQDPCGDRIAILEGTWTREGN
jgi:hypothetical protein